MKTSNPTLIQLAGLVYKFRLRIVVLKHLLLLLQSEQTSEVANEDKEPKKPQKTSLKSKLFLNFGLFEKLTNGSHGSLCVPGKGVQFMSVPIDISLTTDDAYDFNTDFK